MDSEVVVQEDMEGSWTLLSWMASCLMVFGGALPYVPQYQDIQRSSSSEGFSTRVCLVLLIANILRIFFWIGKQFELTLLLQSVMMILTMFAMLHLCCTVQNTNRVSTRQHRLSVIELFDRVWALCKQRVFVKRKCLASSWHSGASGVFEVRPRPRHTPDRRMQFEKARPPVLFWGDSHRGGLGFSLLLEVERIRGLPALLLRLHRAVCSGHAAAAGLCCVCGDAGLPGRDV
ncbi:hypothetical protein FQN60_014377 [Etheostoma spectabile]|uniref:PQ-loop repeat-containing protein 1 n=1 Tax=Etheostoma spectabile TaxID=54343 RepID=A0A5J5DBD1_9PERO|nr:hypothetical protein FQN60_014377 [Etheostoma spectabile]